MEKECLPQMIQAKVKVFTSYNKSKSKSMFTSNDKSESKSMFTSNDKSESDDKSESENTYP